MKKYANSPADPPQITDDDIRSYAYHLYEQSGRAPNRDLENWLEAKACLLARARTKKSTLSVVAQHPAQPRALEVVSGGGDRGARI